MPLLLHRRLGQIGQGLRFRFHVALALGGQLDVALLLAGRLDDTHLLLAFLQPRLVDSAVQKAGAQERIASQLNACQNAKASERVQNTFSHRARKSVT